MATGLKAAIIGCGRVAQAMETDPLREKPCTHIGAYRGLGGVEVVAGADIEEERLSEVSERYGVKGLYTDYREMLETERPDIVSITAFATDRCEMLLGAIDAGVKGIWCEKALSASLLEADCMVEAVEASETALIVSHIRRWNSLYRKAREIIESGRIGRLTSISSLFSGSFIHTGTHAFDVLMWFAGEPLFVEARLEEQSGDLPWDVSSDAGGTAQVIFKSGVVASIHACSKKYFVFEFDIVGTEGRLRIGNDDLFELYEPGPSRNFIGADELFLTERPASPVVNVWSEAAGSLLELTCGGSVNPSTVRDGRASLEMAIAVHKSSSEGGSRISFPLSDRELYVPNR